MSPLGAAEQRDRAQARMATQRVRAALVSVGCGDAFCLAQRAEQIAASQLCQIGIAPAAARQFHKQGWLVFDTVEALWEERHAVEVRANADIVVARNFRDVLDVISDDAQINFRTRIGAGPRDQAFAYGCRIA